MNAEELKLKASRMQSFLETPAPIEPNDLMERLNHLSVLMAQSGQCLADAKYLLDQRKSDSITIALKEAMAGDWSISITNKKIDALCKEENYLVNLLDRINSTAGKQIEAIRTMISFIKSTMQLWKNKSLYRNY